MISYTLTIADQYDLKSVHNVLGDDLTKAGIMKHFKSEVKKKHHANIHPLQWQVEVQKVDKRGHGKTIAILALPSLKKRSNKQLEIDTITVVKDRMIKLSTKCLSNGVTVEEQTEYWKLKRVLEKLLLKHKLI